MYQPYYIVGGLGRVDKTFNNRRRYNQIRKEEKMSEKFSVHHTTNKQILESYQEYCNSKNYF